MCVCVCVCAEIRHNDNKHLVYLIDIDVGEVCNVFPRFSNELHVLDKDDDVFQLLVPEAAGAQGQHKVNEFYGVYRRGRREYHDHVIAEIVFSS